MLYRILTGITPYSVWDRLVLQHRVAITLETQLRLLALVTLVLCAFVGG